MGTGKVTVTTRTLTPIMGTVMVVMSSELRALDGDGAHTLDDLSFCCLQYSKLMSKKDKNKHKTKQKKKKEETFMS
jgi:hypothetical protein